MPLWMPPMSCATTRSTEPETSFNASTPSGATFCVAQHLHRITNAFGVPVRGGNGNGINAALNESADVGKDAFAVQFAERIASGGNRGAADEVKIRVARGLELRAPLLRDAFHIAHGDQPPQQ